MTSVGEALFGGVGMTRGGGGGGGGATMTGGGVGAGGGGGGAHPAIVNAVSATAVHPTS